MNRTYKNASYVLVWLGPDGQAMADPSFKQVRKLDETFRYKEKREKFRIGRTDHLEERSKDPWIPLMHVTHLPWSRRSGTRAAATLFWGEEEIEWELLHRVCETLTDYHHLRKHFDIDTALIKYTFKRFIKPPEDSRHANRFSLMYELHRTRHLQVIDQRDRVFAMLGHFSVHTDHAELMALRANYQKTTEQVYVDVVIRALTGDSSLITLAAVQHQKLQSGTKAPNPASGQIRTVDEKTLPSWVSDWRTYVTHILSEPISPHSAHGEAPPKLAIDRSTLVLRVWGMKLDVIEACSKSLAQREFHLGLFDRALAIETLWHDICGKGRFDLEKRYINGGSAFFAYIQKLSNGCVATSSREPQDHHEIPQSEWLTQGAAYLTKVLGQSMTCRQRCTRWL